MTELAAGQTWVYELGNDESNHEYLYILELGVDVMRRPSCRFTFTPSSNGSWTERDEIVRYLERHQAVVAP